MHQFRDQTYSVANDSKWPHAAQRYVRTGTIFRPRSFSPHTPSRGCPDTQTDRDGRQSWT